MIKELLIILFLFVAVIFYICVLIGAIGYAWEMIFHPESRKYDEPE